MPPIATSAPNDYSRFDSDDFLKYRAPSNTQNTSNYPFNYPSYSNEEQPSSWLHGTDFNSMAGDLLTSSKPADFSYGNMSGIGQLNLDEIKIGDETMENVLKALDPAGSGGGAGSSSFLNGLNLDSSFTQKNNSSRAYTSGAYTSGPYTSGYSANNNTNTNTNTSANANNNNTAYTPYSTADYLKPANRSNIIKSHNSQAQKVSFQHPPTSQFFSPSNDASFVNMTLPAMDTSIIFSDKPKVPGYGGDRNYSSSSTVNQNKEKDQFVSFAVQQYRMLAAMNPEMMRSPENTEELAERETFKYWGKLFIEERERQARIVLNLQKALTEALSGSAAKGPNVMAHLGAITGDFELETIGKYADQCRKRSQMIQSYFHSKRH